jgi:hypothetical protein
LHFVVLRVGLGKPSEISVPYLREPRVEFARLLRGKRLPAGVVGTAVNRGGPMGVYGPLNYDAADPYPATRRKLEEGPGFEVLTPTESFTLDGDDEYVVEVEPVPLGA